MMNQQAPFHSVADHRSPDYNPCPKLHPDAADPHRSHPPPAAGATTIPANSNPYVSSTPSGNSSSKNAMDSVRDVLGKWGKKAAEATKKAENLAGNMWQHLKTSPNVADAAVARISHGTKVLAEGGYEKVFRQTFQTTPEEQLQKTYACYLSTSVGPIMGTLYLSTSKLAFCSDNPLSYQAGEKMEWSYYKVIIQLTQVKAVNPSTNKMNPAEKYIQIVTVDKHEFWFMAFVNYDSAVKNLKGLPQMHSYSQLL